MIWCERGGSWTYGAKNARPIFEQIIKAIAKGERVYLAVSPIKFGLRPALKRHSSVVITVYGVVDDETNGHVDNICAFVNADTVVLGWTDEAGEQHNRCKADLEVLEGRVAQICSRC